MPSIDLPVTVGGTAARAEYLRRLADRSVQLDRLTTRERVLGLGRVVVFFAGVAVAWEAFAAKLVSGWWLSLPLLIFLTLLLAHDRLQRAWRRASRAVAFYKSGVARLDQRWPGQGTSGTRYLDDKHPGAADLDLFGVGSLFERLCQARTRDGEDTLAAWLTRPASADEARARQAAVAELRDALDFREDLACVGATLPSGVDLREVASWGSAPLVFTVRWPRFVVLLLGLGTLGACLEWLFGPWPAWPFLSLVLLEIALAMLLSRRIKRVLHAVDRRAHDLGVLARLLACLEKQTFAATRLQDLHATLISHSPSASPGRVVSSPVQTIAVLANWIELLQSRRNQFFAPFACLLMWSTQMAYALEAWRARHGHLIKIWLDVVGQFEALASLAGYAFENSDDPFPDVVEGKACFDGEGLGHPLLPLERCVRNDLHFVESLQLLVVSGSNMSGKSTFLRTVGVNAVLALAGAPVRAQRLKLSPLVVGATLRIQDSLQAGISRFYAEVLRVRQIVELSRGQPPLLFLLDELFAGTNSHDRRVGAEAVVRSLVKSGAIGLVTTHDLALTSISEQFGPRAANVHFADHFENGAMVFDYSLRPGVVQHSNALALMRAVGLDV